MATEEELRAANEEGLLADWLPCTARPAQPVN
jgi:hypothetical protein